MAEEVREETIAKEKAEHLFAMLVKSELSAEERSEAAKIVSENPDILTQKEFTEKFKMPNMAQDYHPGVDINDLTARSAQSLADVKKVLENLKEIEIKKGAKTVKASAYMLNEARLPNGEIIGTQLAKNIHFMGTAKKDKNHQFFEDASENEAARNAMNGHLEQSAKFYKTLYENPEGYGANPNRRNQAGQKVGELMEMSQKIRDGQGIGVQKIELQDQTIEDVQKRTFMRPPVQEKLTVEQLKTMDYQGTLTVEQKEQLQKIKDKEEAEAANIPGDKHRPEKKEKKTEKFRDEDVIKYMYEEWFLAGMSWIFDQAEKGLDMLLDKLIDERREAHLRNEQAAREARDEMEKAVLEKACTFDKIVEAKDKKRKQELAKHAASYKDKCNRLKEFFIDPTPEKESVLKAEHGEEFIEKLKADYAANPAKVEKFLDKCPQKLEQVLRQKETMQRIAMAQVHLEMMDEVMRSTKAWRKEDENALIEDSELSKRYDDRVAIRVKELEKATAVLTEDSRLRAEAEYSSLSAEEKAQYAQKQVLEPYDEMIKTAPSDKAKQGLIEDKKHFEDLYFAKTDEGKALSAEAREELLFERIATLKTQQFLFEQAALTDETAKDQNKDRSEKRFDICGLYPHKETRKGIEYIQERISTVTQNGLNDQDLFKEDHMEESAGKQRSLLEEAMVANSPILFDSMKTVLDEQSLRIAERRENLNVRRERFQKYKEQLDKTPAQRNLSEAAELFGQTMPGMIGQSKAR